MVDSISIEIYVHTYSSMCCIVFHMDIGEAGCGNWQQSKYILLDITT